MPPASATAASPISCVAPFPPGVGAASRSKDDIVRVAAGEMRTWLEHLNLNEELAKVLAKLVIEVKTEIRFRPTDDGKLTPEASNDIKVKPNP